MVFTDLSEEFQQLCDQLVEGRRISSELNPEAQELLPGIVGSVRCRAGQVADVHLLGERDRRRPWHNWMDPR